MVWPKVNQKETLSRLLGDKTKLSLRLSGGTTPKTPTHVFQVDMAMTTTEGDAKPYALAVSLCTNIG